jgi:threonylcarbamoyladenosine tRNA methylthiotransferase MtaB
MKVSIQTLGCKVNQSESFSIRGRLKENGYEVVEKIDASDICIINTCTVTARSDYQSRQLIRRAVRSGARVIATGCYAQLRPDDLKNIDGLDLIIGNSGKGSIIEHLNALSGKNGNALSYIDSPDVPLTSGPYSSTRSRAFLKIQDGCNSSCTYCSVPLARGKSRSLGQSEVIKAAARLCSDGYNEIVITGIHIGYYGADLIPESSLFEIVEKLSMTFPQTRFRISSLEPQEVTSDLLELVKSDNVCSHLHIPLQSGSDRVLKRMNRGYSASFFSELIREIHQEHPGISIGTDVITGFPGEKDDDFKSTYELLEGLPISYLHVFPYSRRPDTPAAGYKEQVAESIKNERSRKLINLGLELKKDYLLSQLNRTLDVIIESKRTTDGFYRAISDNYIRTLITGKGLLPGQRIKVTVKEVCDLTLICSPL